MIKNIAIEKLIPHPNNPRKVIGDITELPAHKIDKNYKYDKNEIKEWFLSR